MDIREFAFLKEKESHEAPGDTVDLVCDSCGERVTRPVFIALVGHLHDQKCTYICTVCRGTMRDTNFNQDNDEEK